MAADLLGFVQGFTQYGAKTKTTAPVNTLLKDKEAQADRKGTVTQISTL